MSFYQGKVINSLNEPLFIPLDFGLPDFIYINGFISILSVYSTSMSCVHVFVFTAKLKKLAQN